ncbi:MAG: DUF3810 domain-containing protein [Ginsengibacter sp.]
MVIKKYWRQNKNLWIIALLLIVIIKLFSINRGWVENIYSTKIYLYFSRFLRFLFGWIPFSLGDIVYLMAGSWLLWKVVKNIQLALKRKLSKQSILRKFFGSLLIFSFIYIIFNVFWGINYNRKGIVYQLKLPDLQYDTSDLLMLQNILLQKVNASKIAVMKKAFSYPSQKDLIQRAEKCYGEAEKEYPFLHYQDLSVKSSLYGWLGNYLGFTGYYNPFTGEAQINTTVPEFLRPYVATHEMAHQLGYAKENEANFVGYLAAVNSHDTLFHYSAYFDLYIYANREVFYFDSSASRNSLEQLMPEVKNDILEMRQFDLDHQSFLEPAITWMYGHYLKMNQQPQGMHSYNAVVAMLIDYYKKYGKI